MLDNISLCGCPIPIPPSRRCGLQFRAEELDDLMDLVESFLPISAQNWQAVADVHLENYRREAQTAESLCRKFQEISHRTGPTGDPICPPYVIKAKRINRQLVQMIDASSGGSEARRSDDGLSDASASQRSSMIPTQQSKRIRNLAKEVKQKMQKQSKEKKLKK